MATKKPVKKTVAKKTVAKQKFIVNDRLKNVLGAGKKKPMSLPEKLDFIASLRNGSNKRPPAKGKK